MSCTNSPSYTYGFDCNTVYTLGGAVAQDRANEIFALGKTLGLTEFNPTSVNWDAPVQWKDGDGGLFSTGAGLAMLFGFGLGLTVLTVLLTIVERKMSGVAATSEHFNTAGRDVKTGLTASVIVSQWTWAATLLQSSNVAWNYGITGPFWYAAGATIQILLFGILAIEVKRRAPNAHTFLEMIDVRWGTTAHITFFIFGILANLIVSAMLLLGGCAVFKNVASIPIEASSFLIPALTLLYTLVGGLKATFLASYFHTAIIFVILILMVTLVYGVEIDCTNTEKQCNSLGSASVMWERLTFMTALPTRTGDVVINNVTVGGFHQGPAHPVKFHGNRQGSYLTMMSEPGIKFGIINVIGNFGTVFVDQSYWQSAIAAKPASAHKGFILGGMVWFTIPFALATSLGLAGNALNVALTSGDAGNGLVPPASAIALMGTTGGVLIIIQLTMAILSTGSAECIAVSSLWSYDVYRKYINPNATGKQILLQSRIMVCVWALVMAISSIVLNAIPGIGLGWVYNFMGTAIGSAVVPIACAVWTDKLDAFFAQAAAWIGMITAVAVWMIIGFSTADAELGKGKWIAAEALGQLNAQLFGSLTALLASLAICVIGCIVKPMNFDWDKMVTGIHLVAGDGGENAKVNGGNDWESSPEFLTAAAAWIKKWGWGYTIFLCLVWPLAAIPFGAFGKSTFQIWASIAMCWGWGMGLLIVILPLYESGASILAAMKSSSTPTPAVKAAETATA